MPVLSTIQSGTATIAAAATSGTVAITSVDMAKSLLFFSSRCDNGTTNAGGRLSVGGRISSATQLTFERYTASSSSDTTIRWYVVTFTSGVSVQRGSVSNVSDVTADVAISAVTVAQSWAYASSKGENSWDYGGCQLNRAWVQSSTALRLRSKTPANTNTLYWEVIDYQGATVALYTGTHPDGTNNGTITITSVTMGRTFLVGNAGHPTNAYGAPRFEVNWRLTAATVLTWERWQGYEARAYAYQVVSTPDVSVQRGVMTIGNSTTTQTAAVTSVNTARTVAKLNCANDHVCIEQIGVSSALDFKEAVFEIRINSATQLGFQRQVSDADSEAQGAWETVEWLPATRRGKFFQFLMAA